MNKNNHTFNYLEEFGVNFKNHDFVEYFLWKAPNIDSRIAVTNNRYNNTFYSELLFRNLIKYLGYDYDRDVDVSNTKGKCDLRKKITFRLKVNDYIFSAFIRRIRNMIAHGYFYFQGNYCEFINHWQENNGQIKVDMEKVYSFVREHEDVNDYLELVKDCLKDDFYVINIEDVRVNNLLMMHNVRKIKIKSKLKGQLIDLIFFNSKESYVKKANFVSFVEDIGLDEGKTAFICVNVDSKIRNFNFYQREKEYIFVTHSRAAEFLHSLK